MVESADRLKNARINLDSIFQLYATGDVVCNTVTKIKNGGQDIKDRYAGRDNKPENASTVVNFKYGGGLALNQLFNKTNATYDVTIGGTVTYDGTAKTPTLTHSPSNTPTQATITSQTNAGSYTTANFTITLPGNYLPGNYTGTFTISPANFNISITQGPSELDGYYISVRILGPPESPPTLANFSVSKFDDPNVIYETFQISKNLTSGIHKYFYNTDYAYSATSVDNNYYTSGTFNFLVPP